MFSFKYGMGGMSVAFNRTETKIAAFNLISVHSKTCLKRPLKNPTKTNYRLMQVISSIFELSFISIHWVHLEPQTLLYHLFGTGSTQEMFRHDLKMLTGIKSNNTSAFSKCYSIKHHL